MPNAQHLIQKRNLCESAQSADNNSSQ
jgi:hypothetical protein